MTYSPGKRYVPGKGERYYAPDGKFYGNEWGYFGTQLGNFFSMKPDASAGWEASVDAVKKAKKDGTQLAPNGPIPDADEDDTPTPTPTPTTTTTTNRDVVRGGAKGTQTSPAGANWPALFKSLQDQGMQTGYQSNTLPTVGGPNLDNQASAGLVNIPTGINAGRKANPNDPNYQQYLDGEMRIGENEVVIEPGQPMVVTQNGGDQGYTPNNSTQTMKTGMVGNIGSDEIKSEGLRNALNDVSGMQSYMKNLYKDDANPDGRMPQYDRRAVAFLGGSDDSMLSLRQAEAAQGYMRQNGVNMAIDSQGNPLGEFSDEGRKQLISQGYGNAGGQAFLDQYKVDNGIPSAQQSGSSRNPYVATTPDNEQMNSIAYTKPPGGVDVGMDPIEANKLQPNYFTSGPFSGYVPREPYMRF